MPQDERTPGQVVLQVTQGASDVLKNTPYFVDSRAMPDRLDDALREMGAPDALRLITGPVVSSLLNSREKTVPNLALKARAIFAAQESSLKRIMVHIPPAKAPQAERAILDFVTGLGELMGPQPKKPVDASVLAQLHEALKIGYGGEPPPGWEEVASQLLTTAQQASHGILQGSAETSSQIAALGKTLVENLEACVELSNPVSREALNEIKADIASVWQLVGNGRALGEKFEDVISRSPKPTLDEALLELQPLGEAMGTGVIKTVQKLGPAVLMALLSRSKKEGADLDFGQEVGAALIKKMWDGVTPMRRDEAEAQFRLTFKDRPLYPGDPHGTGEPVFLEIDLERPIKSASMAQVYCAWIKDPQDPARAIEVAVKVYRTNSVANIDGNVRAMSFLGRVLDAYTALGPDMDFGEKLILGLGSQAVDVQKAVVNQYKREAKPEDEKAEVEASVHDARYHGHSVVPRIYSAECGPTVLTMDFIRGRSLQDRLEQLWEKEGADKVTPSSTLMNPGDNAEAEKRATLWARQSLGLKPLTCVATPDGKNTGFDLKMRFADPVYRDVTAQMSLNGAVSHNIKLPDLSKRALKKTLIGLCAEFFTQLLRRRVQGDPTNGNILVSEGNVNGWIDWGNTLKFTISDMLVPSRMVVGLMLGMHKMAARALVSMSEARNLPTDEKAKLVEAIAKDLKTRANQRKLDMPKYIAEAPRLAARVQAARKADDEAESKVQSVRNNMKGSSSDPDTLKKWDDDLRAAEQAKETTAAELKLAEAQLSAVPPEYVVLFGDASAGNQASKKSSLRDRMIRAGLAVYGSFNDGNTIMKERRMAPTPLYGALATALATFGATVGPSFLELGLVKAPGLEPKEVSESPGAETSSGSANSGANAFRGKNKIEVKWLEIASTLAQIVGATGWNVAKDITLGLSKSEKPTEKKVSRMRETGGMAAYRPVSDFPAHNPRATVPAGLPADEGLAA
ncbi:MAG: AarF/UbiB family protein [Myxococcaceae bacterium]